MDMGEFPLSVEEYLKLRMERIGYNIPSILSVNKEKKIVNYKEKKNVYKNLCVNDNKRLVKN